MPEITFACRPNRAVLFGLAIVTLAGCRVKSSGSGDTGVELVPKAVENIAVGASFDVAVVDSCSDARTRVTDSGGKIPSEVTIDFQRQTCDFSSIDAVDAAMSTDESVFTVDDVEALEHYAIFRMTAVGEGDAELEVAAATSTGKYDVAGQYRVWQTNRVEVTGLCGAHHASPNQSDRLFALVGETVTFEYGRFHDDLKLTGYDYFPVEADGLEVTAVDTSRFTVELPETPGSFAITSPADPDLDLVVEVIEPAQIDTLALSHEPATCATALRFAPSVGTASALCAGQLEVQLVIETPDVCAFNREGDLEVTVSQDFFSEENPGGVQLVLAKGPGVCRVTGSLVDGELIESAEIIFRDCEVWDRAIDQRVQALTPSSPEATLVFTYSGDVFEHDGASVTAVTEFVDVPTGVSDAWVGDDGTVFGLAYGELARWNAGERTSVDLSDTYIAGTNLGDSVLLVGAGAAQLSARGLEVVDIPEGGYTDVWTSGSDFAVATGFTFAPPTAYQAILTQYDGSVWSMVELDHKVRLNGVWGSGPDDMVVVGGDCTLLRFDGTGWYEVDLGCDVDLHAVHGASADRVVAVGDQGLVVSWDGISWTTQWVLGAKDLTAVSVTHNSVVVGGRAGLFVGP